MLPCGISLNRVSSLFLSFQIIGVKDWYQLQITNTLFDSHVKNLIKYTEHSWLTSSVPPSVSCLIIIKAELVLVEFFYCHSCMKSTDTTTYSNERLSQNIFKRTEKVKIPGNLEKPEEGIILSCSEFCKYRAKKNTEYLK